MTNREKLAKLVEAYQQKYPNEPHPLTEVGFLTPKILVKIMEEANGRKVRFIWDKNRRTMNPVDVIYED